MPVITVAVSTFRESYFDWVLELLNSLKYQTFKDFTVLLIVNSNYNYFKKLNEIKKASTFPFRINIIYNSQEKGIAHARNIALNEATTPYIAFTDDDAIPDTNWLKIIAGTFMTVDKVGAVTGPVIANWTVATANSKLWFPKELYWVIGCIDKFSCIKSVRNGFASNLALDREVVINCGGFNENFGYKQCYPMVGEEPELCLKLQKKGKFTLWNPKLIVYHRITSNRLKLANVLIRSYIEGRTKAHLKKLLGNEATSVEKEHMWAVMKAFMQTGSLRSKVYLATSTSAVAVGYFLTDAKIRLKHVLGQNWV